MFLSSIYVMDIRN